MHTYLITSAL